MKTLKCLFIIGSLMYICIACEQSRNTKIEDNLHELPLHAKTSSVVEIPFKGKLFTGQAEDALTEICSFTSPSDFWGLEHQVGGGSATHLGKFTVDLKFCFHVVLNDQGLPDLDGGFGEYGCEYCPEGVVPIIVASNADQLFAEVREQSRLIPIQNGKYNFEFDDVWYITGGTGRFENASGEFIWHGMVRSDGTGTDHKWNGTIILPKKVK